MGARKTLMPPRRNLVLRKTLVSDKRSKTITALTPRSGRVNIKSATSNSSPLYSFINNFLTILTIRKSANEVSSPLVQIIKIGYKFTTLTFFINHIKHFW